MKTSQKGTQVEDEKELVFVVMGRGQNMLQELWNIINKIEIG